MEKAYAKNICGKRCCKRKNEQAIVDRGLDRKRGQGPVFLSKTFE